ncbi:unnamed protein product [Diamesa tonsa]
MKFNVSTSLMLILLSSVSCFELKCDFYEGYCDEKYTCNAKELIIEQPCSTITSVVGRHVPRKSNLDVGCLHIYNQNVKYNPQGYMDHFPNLLTFVVGYSNLQFVRRSDFTGAGQLRMVYFPGNTFHTLTSDTFMDLKNVKRLVLNHNKIRTVGSKLLLPMTKLHLGLFAGNDCIDTNYTGTAQIEKLKLDLLEHCFDETLEIPTMEEQKLNEAKDEINKLQQKMSFQEEHIKLLELKNVILTTELDNINKTVMANNELKRNIKFGFKCHSSD